MLIASAPREQLLALVKTRTPIDGREHTSIEVRVDVHNGPHGHTHLDLLYLLRLLDGAKADPTPQPGESQDVAGFSWDQALAIAHPRMTGINKPLRLGRHMTRRPSNRAGSWPGWWRLERRVTAVGR